MARLLYQQDSTPMHQRMARRHIRLCGQIIGAASLGQAMQPKLDVLTVKARDRHAAEELCENVQDDLVLTDSYLDNGVRNLFENARMYDRNNMTRITEMLFPHLTFSDIINMPLSEEPLKVAQLIEKLGQLEEGNELRNYIETLTEASKSVNTVLEARRNTAENLSRRQADEELARAAVRAQYESNYLDARKQFGRQHAEHLFPKVANRRGKRSGGADEADREE
ncbi:MAG: hypothetical protein LBV26_04695 [Bacteroidales bacterium]|jgi:ribosomal protein L17|nr:hypothetical protein [Bacteroidales bacterium]